MDLKPVKLMMDSKIQSVSRLGHYIAYLWQYREIFKQMVNKDLKARFKNTVLGYFWHLLNPLTQIVIYYLIFTVIFGRDIPNYWVYVSTGMFAFSFFMNSSSGSCNSIVNNRNLVTKMALAREVVVASKVVTGLITLGISYGLLILLLILTGVGVSVNILYILVILVGLTAFNLGMAFLLSSITVYLRDVSNAVSLLFGCMMFAIPVFYLKETRATPMMELFWSVNPLYYYINTIHDTMYYGIAPNNLELTVCIMCGISMLIIGLLIFKKLEGGFAERL